MIIAYFVIFYNANCYLVHTNVSYYINYLHGKGAEISLLKQSTRWPLVASCLKFCLLGFNPETMAVAVAMVNSFPPFSLQHCVILISKFRLSH